MSTTETDLGRYIVERCGTRTDWSGAPADIIGGRDDALNDAIETAPLHVAPPYPRRRSSRGRAWRRVDCGDQKR